MRTICIFASMFILTAPALAAECIRPVEVWVQGFTSCHTTRGTKVQWESQINPCDTPGNKRIAVNLGACTDQGNAKWCRIHIGGKSGSIRVADRSGTNYVDCRLE